MVVKRFVSALVLASFLGMQPGLAPAWADNAMNYRFLSAKDADSLPKAGGTLGLNVGPGEQITSGGMTFRLLRVNSVKSGAAGAQAGFRQGDQIISVDGRVFSGVPAFADYVGVGGAGTADCRRLPAGRRRPAGSAEAHGDTRGAGRGRCSPSRGFRSTGRPSWRGYPGEGGWHTVYGEQGRHRRRGRGVVRVLQARLLQPFQTAAARDGALTVGQAPFIPTMAS